MTGQRGRPRKTVSQETLPLDGITITVDELEKTSETVSEGTPAVEPPVIQPGKEGALKRAADLLRSYGRIREGSSSGKMPTVYTMVLPRGQPRYFTLPLWVDDNIVADAWRICKPYMSSEDFVCFLKENLGITNLVLYSYFRQVSIS